METETLWMKPDGVYTEGRKVKVRYAFIPSPPQDQPSKRYLLDGPPLDMDLATFKRMEALNAVLRLRSLEHASQKEYALKSLQERWVSEAARRLPM